MARITLASTIKGISIRSAGIQWDSTSKGFGLILTQGGYALTAQPDLDPEKRPARVVVPREDGSPLPHRHVLTSLERERAILAILAG
jgi:hypothetical protein